MAVKILFKDENGPGTLVQDDPIGKTGIAPAKKLIVIGEEETGEELFLKIEQWKRDIFLENFKETKAEFSKIAEENGHSEAQLKEAVLDYILQALEKNLSETNNDKLIAEYIYNLI